MCSGTHSPWCQTEKDIQPSWRAGQEEKQADEKNKPDVISAESVLHVRVEPFSCMLHLLEIKQNSLQQTLVWNISIDFQPISVCMCVCVCECVSTFSSLLRQGLFTHYWLWQQHDRRRVGEKICVQQLQNTLCHTDLCGDFTSSCWMFHLLAFQYLLALFVWGRGKWKDCSSVNVGDGRWGVIKHSSCCEEDWSSAVLMADMAGVVNANNGGFISPFFRLRIGSINKRKCAL